MLQLPSMAREPLPLAASISEVDPGSIIARNGTINLNGGIAQTIPASTFLNDDLNNLIISNTDNASGVTLGGNVNIYESLTYSASGTNLNTGGYLTLKSTQAQTAWIGDMTGHTINGDVTVERYIATGTSITRPYEGMGIPGDTHPWSSNDPRVVAGKLCSECCMYFGFWHPDNRPGHRHGCDLCCPFNENL